MTNSVYGIVLCKPECLHGGGNVATSGDVHFRSQQCLRVVIFNSQRIRKLKQSNTFILVPLIAHFCKCLKLLYFCWYHHTTVCMYNCVWNTSVVGKTATAVWYLIRASLIIILFLLAYCCNFVSKLFLLILLSVIALTTCNFLVIADVKITLVSTQFSGKSYYTLNKLWSH